MKKWTTYMAGFLAFVLLIITAPTVIEIVSMLTRPEIPDMSTKVPTNVPTISPTKSPTAAPTRRPTTKSPTTKAPTGAPTTAAPTP